MTDIKMVFVWVVFSCNLFTVVSNTVTCCMMLLMLLWRVWHVRNEVIHQKPAPPVEVSRRFLESYVQSLLLIKQHPNSDVTRGKQVIGVSLEELRLQRRSSISMTKVIKQWTRPPPEWHKLNIDVSFSSKDGRAGIGMILRDNSGNGVFTSCRSLLHCDDALEAELIACKEGIEMALQYTSKPIMVESDCASVVLLATAHEEDCSALAHMVRDVRRLFTGQRVLGIKKVDRSQNIVSHKLANHARIHDISGIWMGQEENFVSRLICDDCIASV